MTAFQQTSIRQALGIMFMVGASVSQGAVLSVAGGWDTVCLSNRYVSLQIVPSIGGRVMAYGLGKENVLWVNPGLAGKAPPASGVGPAGEWLNYGGDKLWPAPQGWDNAEQWPGPPDAILDGGPYTLEHLPGGAYVAALRLTSGEDRRSGIQLSRVIRLHEDSTRVSFEATMKNSDNKPRRWGIWSHTQLDGGRKGGGHNPEKYTTVAALTNCPAPDAKGLSVDLYTVIGYPKVRRVKISVTRFGEPAADEAEVYRLQLERVKVMRQ